MNIKLTVCQRSAGVWDVRLQSFIVERLEG